MAFSSDMSRLIAPLDPVAHEVELRKLKSCRRLSDLEYLAASDDGWLSTTRRDPRLKLIRHGTGTFLVVQYDDGWSKTLSQAPFPKAR